MGLIDWGYLYGAFVKRKKKFFFYFNRSKQVTSYFKDEEWVLPVCMHVCFEQDDFYSGTKPTSASSHLFRSTNITIYSPFANNCTVSTVVMESTKAPGVPRKTYIRVRFIVLWISWYQKWVRQHLKKFFTAFVIINDLHHMINGTLCTQNIYKCNIGLGVSKRKFFSKRTLNFQFCRQITFSNFVRCILFFAVEEINDRR